MQLEPEESKVRNALGEGSFHHTAASGLVALQVGHKTEEEDRTNCLDIVSNIQEVQTGNISRTENVPVFHCAV